MIKIKNLNMSPNQYKNIQQLHVSKNDVTLLFMSKAKCSLRHANKMWFLLIIKKYHVAILLQAYIAVLCIRNNQHCSFHSGLTTSRMFLVNISSKEKQLHSCWWHRGSIDSHLHLVLLWLRKVKVSYRKLNYSKEQGREYIRISCFCLGHHSWEL